MSHQDRESMRLPMRKWMPSIPLLGQKVDVITHCRKELARLNVEIEEDQLSADQLDVLDSAAVQFKRLVDAHLVCQSVAYHSPFCLLPQHVGASPESVIWKNVSIKWWEHYIRILFTLTTTTALILGWAVPVAFPGFLSQLSYLTTLVPRLRLLGPPVFGMIQGVLPQVSLMVLTSQLPNVIRLLVQQQGFVASAAIELAVQRYYFWFLFVQVFLTVALSSSITTLLEVIYQGFDSVSGVLATNLPKSGN